MPVGASCPLSSQSRSPTAPTAEAATNPPAAGRGPRAFYAGTSSSFLSRFSHRGAALPRLAGAGLLWLATLTGGGPSPAAAQTATRAPGRQGEAFTFSLRFLGSFDAGRARMAVSPPVASPTGPVINVVAEAEATGFAKALTGLHEDYRLVLDAATLLPRRLQLMESGLRNRTATIDITDRRIDIFVKQPPLEKRWSGLLPSQPLEPLAVLLLLRAARLNNGDKLDLIVMDGTAFYQGTMEVTGRQELSTAQGTRAAIKILCRGERISENGIRLGRPPRTAMLWVSDDPSRLPLRVEGETELGTAEFVLTGYESGRRALAVPKKLLGISERSATDPPPPPLPGPPPRPAAPAAPAKPAGSGPAPASVSPGSSPARPPGPSSTPAPAAAPGAAPTPAPGTVPAKSTGPGPAAVPPGSPNGAPASGATAPASARSAAPATAPAAPGAAAPAAGATAAAPAKSVAPGATPAAPSTAATPGAAPAAAPGR